MVIRMAAAFFLTLLLVLGGSTTYMGLRLTQGLPQPWRGLVWALLAALVVLIPVSLLFLRGGTGYWGPPIRMGSPSEITLLRLVGAEPEA